MRKLIVLSFISLDGVMQAPGGPEEDTSGNFPFGGWTVPFSDHSTGMEMVKQMSRDFDLLLGRKTFDIFAGYWPKTDADHPIGAPINNATKYVATRSPLKTDWKNSVRIEGDVAEGVKKLKEQDGPQLHVHGSGNFIQTLLKHDLVDEFWLKTFPVVLGQGKRLFAEGTMPASFELTEHKVFPTGVIFANYRRAGDVKTGSF
jgi:dihydrofolate reductase